MRRGQRAEPPGERAGSARDSFAGMTAVARRLHIVHYPESDHMGEDALQRFIVEVLRPLIAFWFLGQGRRLFVGADQFIYSVEGDPTQRIAPDIYVLPGVDPDSVPSCWKLWELTQGPSFVLEIVSKDFHEDYDEAPVENARIGTQELVIFDPRVTPRSRVRVRWQVYRRVKGRGFRLVEKSNEDRVFSRELGCFLRMVGEGLQTRLRLGTGERGDTLVPTPEEQAVRQRDEAARQRDEAAQQRDEATRQRDEARDEIARLKAVLDAQTARRKRGPS